MQDKKAEQCRIHFHIFLFIFKRNIKGPWLTKMANYRDPIRGEILWRKGEWNSSHWFPQPAPWNITGVHLTKNVWWSWNGDGRLAGREVWTQDIFDLRPIKIIWLSLKKSRQNPSGGPRACHMMASFPSFDSSSVSRLPRALPPHAPASGENNPNSALNHFGKHPSSEVLRNAKNGTNPCPCYSKCWKLSHSRAGASVTNDVNNDPGLKPWSSSDESPGFVPQPANDGRLIILVNLDLSSAAG